MPMCTHTATNYHCCSHPHSVVLYNCGRFSGDDCSGRLGLSADYNCGYCRPDCNLNSLACAGSSLIQAPNFEQCGAFTVTVVSELFKVFFLSDYFLITIYISDLPRCWSCCWRHSTHHQWHQPGCLSKGEHQHPHRREGVCDCWRENHLWNQSGVCGTICNGSR